MKYYIIPQDKIAEYTPLMEQSLGHDNIWIRMSVDGAEGLMEFTEELAPEGYTAYSREEVQMILVTAAWQRPI